MRFGLVHRIMTDALATLGLLSLLTGGALNPTMSVVTGVCMAMAVLIPERFQDHPYLRSLGVVSSLSLLGIQLFRAVSGGDLLALIVEFAAALQVIRVATRRGAAHDQQIILLALLHLVAGTVLGGGLAYAFSLVGFLVIAPGSLVLSHLRREVEGNYRQGARDRTGLPVDVPRILRSRRVISRGFLVVTCSLSIPVFIFTALLFLVFPRVGLSLLLLNHSRSARMIGFSAQVDLGGVGKLRSDPTIAMRVEMKNSADKPAARLALYLRGTSFDRYSQGTWSRTEVQHRPVMQAGGEVWVTGHPLGEEAMTVDLQPIEPPIVFLPADAVGFRVEGVMAGSRVRGPMVTGGPGGEYKYEAGAERGLTYAVYRGRARPRALSVEERARYLSVPNAIVDKIAPLAERWSAGAQDDGATALLIEEHLRTNYRYDLESPSGAAPNPLLHFLFESHSGHCEFYSTAMAMLLRTRGIPTRNVTGFIGGTYNRFGGFYAVRQGDAHSWVEVYLDDKGWTRFDPTPPSSSAPGQELTGMFAFMRDVVEAMAQRWSRHVVGYDMDQQIEIFKSVRQQYRELGGPQIWTKVRSRFPALGTLACLTLVFLAWRRFGGFRLRGSKEEANPRVAAHLRVVSLYEGLEEVLRQLGIARPVSAPPLAHAQALSGVGHPAASEVLELTELYLQARFGSRELSAQEEVAFQTRIRALRHLKKAA